MLRNGNTLLRPLIGGWRIKVKTEVQEETFEELWCLMGIFEADRTAFKGKIMIMGKKKQVNWRK